MMLIEGSNKQKAVIKAQITPLKKKLKNCRDPERWNLVALQRARREQAAKRADSEDDEPGDRMVVDSDGAVFGDPLPTKRRRVLAGEGKATGLADPFGGAL
jgi:cyclin H